MMNIAAWFAFVLGIITGGSIMYIRQRKLRMEELGKAAAMTEDILAGRRLRTSAPGDELLLARIENQLVRIQEMLDGTEIDLRDRSPDADASDQY